MSSLHERLQLDLYTRYLSDSFFADIEVSLIRPRAKAGFAQIYEQIEQVLGGIKKKAGKAGASVQVLMPASDQLDPNVPGPRLDVLLTVRIQEIVPINLGPVGTGKTAEEIAEHCIQLGHQFTPFGGNILLFSSMVPTDAFDPRVTVDVSFSVKSGLQPVPKVARPAITAGGSLAFTLSCATAGAAIYYTTDGTYPGSGNTTATLYTGAVTLEAAATVRAAAQKDGLLPSDVVQLSIT
ncbi:MAG TPA: chitobiase/beta-hexosaminidase C-terminal domain-containing protein [Rariglobus sp.]|jgi:hypothetical protein|nr:chitobiase/beta-hexosaminidase C-terminal domain-containing protein [Rariglobus sp.]